MITLQKAKYSFYFVHINKTRTIFTTSSFSQLTYLYSIKTIYMSAATAVPVFINLSNPRLNIKSFFDFSSLLNSIWSTIIH